MTIEALPEETGSNRQVMPKSQAPFLDPTLGLHPLERKSLLISSPNCPNCFEDVQPVHILN